MNTDAHAQAWNWWRSLLFPDRMSYTFQYFPDKRAFDLLPDDVLVIYNAEILKT
jgi:hypothetical protein